MCYENPEELLATIMPDQLPSHEHGHTALDDVDHFCAVSGLSEQRAGKVALDRGVGAGAAEGFGEN